MLRKSEFLEEKYRENAIVALNKKKSSLPQQVELEFYRGPLVTSWRYIIKGTGRGSMLLPMFSLDQVNTLVSLKTYRQGSGWNRMLNIGV